MKNLILLFSIVALLSCDDNTVNNNNPNLPNYTFTVNIDTNLPSYSALSFAGNGIKITQSGVGVRGIFVFNTGSGYTAWDAACPNQALGNCSNMTLNGTNAQCPCDSKLYSLYTGQSAGMQYPLKQYRTELNGTLIRVYN
jgi:nitrite reductase/ring-hydroxylating ferredoxin subunit